MSICFDDLPSGYNVDAIHTDVLRVCDPPMLLSDIQRPSSVHPGAFLDWHAKEFDRVMAKLWRDTGRAERHLQKTLVHTGQYVDSLRGDRQVRVGLDTRR